MLKERFTCKRDDLTIRKRFPHSNHGMYNDLDKLQEFIDLSLEYAEKYL